MSDASYMRGASDGGASNARGFGRNVAGAFSPLRLVSLTPMHFDARAVFSDERRVFLDFDSEPLTVLADLQEFGIPGQEVPLPAGANLGLSTPNSTFNSKRFSDTPAALPPLNEDEYLDMELVRPKSTSSHGAPGMCTSHRDFTDVRSPRAYSSSASAHHPAPQPACSSVSAAASTTATIPTYAAWLVRPAFPARYPRG